MRDVQFPGLRFRRSLGRGHIALCTRLADRLHGPLTPREVRYTRQVTAAWRSSSARSPDDPGLYCLASVRLVAVRQLHRLPLIGLMFAVEYA